MNRLLTALVAIVALAVIGAVPVTTVTGTLITAGGAPAVNTRVYFHITKTQSTGGNIIGPQAFSVVTNSAGQLPSGVTLPQGAVVNISVGTGQPQQVTMPLQGTVDLSTLLTVFQPPTSVVSQVNSGTSTCTTINPAPGVIGPATVNCSTTGSFPLAQNVSANSKKITSLAVDTTTGDALSRNQSTLNSLAAPTTSVSMNSQKLTGLGAPAATGDALSEGHAIGAVTPAAVTATNLTGNGAISVTGTQTNGGDIIGHVSVNGMLNVQAYGAKGDGTTDDTTAIQAAYGAACPSGNCTKPLYFPAGNYVHKALNFSGASNLRIYGAGGHAQTTLLCKNPTLGHTTDPCVDFSGDDDLRIYELYFQNGTNGTDGSTFGWLFGKTASVDATNLILSGVNFASYQNNGYGVVIYGHEVGTLVAAQFAAYSATNYPLVISAANTVGVTSSDQTLATAPVSMTQLAFYKGSFTGDGKPAILFDNGTSGNISEITFETPYCKDAATSGSAGGCFVDTGSGTIWSVRIANMRAEMKDTSPVIALTGPAYGWDINNLDFFYTANQSVASLQFNGGFLRGLLKLSTWDAAHVATPFVTMGANAEASVARIDASPDTTIGNAKGIDYLYNGHLKVVSCAIPTTAASGTGWCDFAASKTATGAPYFDTMYLRSHDSCTTFPTIEIEDITTTGTTASKTAINGATALGIYGQITGSSPSDDYAFVVTGTASAGCASTLPNGIMSATVTIRW